MLQHAYSAVPAGLRILAAVATAPGHCSVHGVARIANCARVTVSKQIRRDYLAHSDQLGLVLTDTGRRLLRADGVVRRTCPSCGNEFEVELFAQRSTQIYCCRDCARAAYEVGRAAE